MTTVTVSVSSKASCFVYIDGDLVPRNASGKGTRNLTAGEHDLFWRLLGQPGSTAKIVLMAGEATLVEIKETKVPPDSGVGTGSRRFKVGG